MRKLGASAQAHQLSAAHIDYTTDVLIYCRRCGGYAEQQAKKLAKPECRPPNKTGQRYLQRIEKGLHPLEELPLGTTWDLQGNGTWNQQANRNRQQWGKPQQEEEDEARQEQDNKGSNTSGNNTGGETVQDQSGFLHEALLSEEELLQNALDPWQAEPE